ncbi:MAG: sulfatase-like hydrolase/transferase [Acidobacteriota bacterium]
MGIASAFALGYVEARQIDARHPVVQGRFRDPIGRAAITALDGLALSLPFLLASSILGTIRKPSRRKDAALAAIVVAGLGALGLASRRAAAALPQFSAAGPPARGDRPSILPVTIDTLRQDHVSAYGSSPVQTPTLDAIAREGTLFERAYSQAPLTTPSHASLLSGLDPPRHGSRYNMVPAKLSANALAPY